MPDPHAGDPLGTGTEAPREQGTATTSASPARAPKPERTRAGAAFNSLVAGAVVLILLLVFILENTQSVKISYFGITWHMSLGIALLLAAVAGALLVGLVGTVRVMQLRHRVRRGPS
jgi:lipopolysaccharide assembly protein A